MTLNAIQAQTVSVCTTLSNPSENDSCADADTADVLKTNQVTLNGIVAFAESAGITFSIESGGIVIDGPTDQVDELAIMVREWKPELIKVLTGETITDVGQCDCGFSLLGLPTRDGYVNRVCPDCGQWFRCLDPYHDWTDQELIELLDERIAIIQHEGQTDQAEAEKMACQWLELIIGIKRFNRIDPNAESASESMIDTPENSSVPKLSSCFNGLEPLQQKWRASVGSTHPPDHFT